MGIFNPIKRKIFFAIPFDRFTLDAYQKIANDLKCNRAVDVITMLLRKQR